MEKKGKNKVLFFVCLIITASFFVVCSFVIYINSTKNPILLKNVCAVQLSDTYYEGVSDTFIGTLQIYYISNTWDERTIVGLVFPNEDVYSMVSSNVSHVDFYMTNQISDAYSSYINYGVYDIKSQIFEVSINKSDYTNEMKLNEAKIIMSDGTEFQVDLGDIVFIDIEQQELMTLSASRTDSSGLIEQTNIVNMDCTLTSINYLPNDDVKKPEIFVNGYKVDEINGLELQKGDIFSTKFNYQCSNVEDKFNSYYTFIKLNLILDNVTDSFYYPLNYNGLNQNIDASEMFEYLKKAGELF